MEQLLAARRGLVQRRMRLRQQQAVLPAAAGVGLVTAVRVVACLHGEHFRQADQFVA